MLNVDVVWFCKFVVFCGFDCFDGLLGCDELWSGVEVSDVSSNFSVGFVCLMRGDVGELFCE